MELEEIRCILYEKTSELDYSSLRKVSDRQLYLTSLDIDSAELHAVALGLAFLDLPDIEGPDHYLAFLYY